MERRPGNLCDVFIQAPQMAAVAKAGQFLHVRVPGFTLRRPISISEVDKENGTLRMLFDIRGQGTKALYKIDVGDELDIMGPLGNGFTLIAPQEKVVVVGGGIGVPPLLQLAMHYGKNTTAILGFRDKDKIILTADFERVGAEIRLATDDGSAGKKGFVTDLLKKRLDEDKPAIVYACGPTVMLRAVASLCKENGVRCQISMEERMGCGVGACLVCACKTKNAQGKIGYAHVCKNGPVFEAEEVVFDD